MRTLARWLRSAGFSFPARKFDDLRHLLRLERLMPGPFVVKDLPSVALVDQLSAVRAVVEIVSLVGRLGAASRGGNEWAEIGQLGHDRLGLHAGWRRRPGSGLPHMLETQERRTIG